MKSPKILLSGGGTGGHIFPAVAIANEIKRMHPDAEFLFIGAKDKMEMEKVPMAGYPIEGLWISGIQRKLTLSNLMFPVKLISSYLKAKRIIKQFKPDLAIGTGGFASGPALKAAANMGIPTVIQEQNAFPGITNKWLANTAKLICVAYPGMDKYFPKSKLLVTGNPIREVLLTAQNNRSKALQEFGLDPSKKVVLIVGGSLGAQSINKALLNIVQESQFKDVQFIWQTGKSTFEEAKALVSNQGLDHVKVFQFIQEMDLAYGAADVVISRAGAIAISELCAIGKAAILVPFPYAAEDHQTKNAQALVQNKAGLMVKDADVNSKLSEVLSELLLDEKQQEAMQKNILSLGKPKAAQNIAEEAFKLLQ